MEGVISLKAEGKPTRLTSGVSTGVRNDSAIRTERGFLEVAGEVGLALAELETWSEQCV